MSQASQLIASQYRNGEVNRRIWDGIMFNVKTYGAKGDGSDDSDAVKRALSAADGEPVFFPDGVYDVSLMTGIGGSVNLVSFGGAIIKGFYYKELNAPQQDVTANVSSNDAYFSAQNITFEGSSNYYGLKIENQSQGTFLRSFSLDNCTFRGEQGLETENCIGSTIRGCEFVHNQVGWKALSCTNVLVTDCRYSSPFGYGVWIDKSDTDTHNREGGENIKFVNCEWTDGVTAIKCMNHNYLWLVNCLMDYFNMGIYMIGSRYARMTQCYIGYTSTDRSGFPLYIAPPKTGCIYAAGEQSLSRVSGIKIVNSEFTGYAGNSDLIDLDGSVTTFKGVEDCSVIESNFFIPNPNNLTKYMLNAKSCDGMHHQGNSYYAPNNNNLLSPWLFTNVISKFSERNNFKNCFKTTGDTITPATGNVGNEIYESSSVTLPTNGTAVTEAVVYVFKNKYKTQPKVVATVRTAPSGLSPEQISVSNVASDASQVFLKARKIDGAVMSAGGNVVVDIIVMGVGDY